jgi:hypothetical protein
MNTHLPALPLMPDYSLSQTMQHDSPPHLPPHLPLAHRRIPALAPLHAPLQGILPPFPPDPSGPLASPRPLHLARRTLAGRLPPQSIHTRQCLRGRYTRHLSTEYPRSDNHVINHRPAHDLLTPLGPIGHGASVPSSNICPYRSRTRTRPEASSRPRSQDRTDFCHYHQLVHPLLPSPTPQSRVRRTRDTRDERDLGTSPYPLALDCHGSHTAREPETRGSRLGRACRRRPRRVARIRVKRICRGGQS